MRIQIFLTIIVALNIQLWQSEGFSLRNLFGHGCQYKCENGTGKY